MSEEIGEKKEIGGNGELENKNKDVVDPNLKKEVPPPTDFKVAEIWIKSGQVMLDASESFWQDRVRALGLIELCKDIIKTAKIKQEKPRIIPGSSGIMNFVRGGFKKKK